MLAGADEQMSEMAFQYGRNVGLAFQLVDDLLDFVSSAEAMGKPTAADLKLGLATAPVLFACEKVNYLIFFLHPYHTVKNIKRITSILYEPHCCCFSIFTQYSILLFAQVKIYSKLKNRVVKDAKRGASSIYLLFMIYTNNQNCRLGCDIIFFFY